MDRIAGFRQIDDQHRGAGRHRQRVDGVPEPTLVDRLHRPADLVQDRADALCRLVIADKGGKGFPQGAAAAAVIPWRVHYLLPFISTLTVVSQTLLVGSALFQASTDLTAVLRSEERRVGKEWVSTCRSRWAR